MSTSTSPHPRPDFRAPGRAKSRLGFTLVELMVVVVIIAVLAVIAIPQITKRLRDRATQQAAQEIAALYRNARSQAMGRGSAVLVRYTELTNTVVVRERLMGQAAGAVGCQSMPVSSCTLAALWDNTDSRLIGQFNPRHSGGYEGLDVQARDTNDTTGINDFEICYSPMGRTYIRSAANVPWNELTSVRVIRVQRQLNDEPIGLIRRVFVMPNGASRLGIAGGT